MANTFAPFGFRQYSGNGSAPTYEQVPVRIAYNATNIFFGDPVVPDANGYVIQGTAALAATNSIAGIFVGCQYLSVSTKRTQWSNYWPGSDVASGNIVTGYIINDPNAKFVAQAGGNTTPIAVGDINANVQFNIGTGNTANGISGAYIDMTVSAAASATYPFRVVGLITDPPGSNGSDTTSGYNYAIVAFNNVSTKTLTGI